MRQVKPWSDTPLHARSRYAGRTASFRYDLILKIVSNITELLRQSENWESTVPQALRLLAQAGYIHFAAVYRNHIVPDGTLVATPDYAWCDPAQVTHASAVDGHEIRYLSDGFDDWKQRLSQHLLVVTNRWDPSIELRNGIARIGVASAVVVPIFVDHTWWGFAGFYHFHTPHKHTPIEVNVLGLFATVLGTAIERKRLTGQVKQFFDADRHRRRLAEALYEMGTSMAAPLDFGHILDNVLIQVQRIVPYDIGLVVFLQGESVRVARTHVEATLGQLSGTELERLVFDLAQTTSLRWVSANGQPLVIPDTSFYPAPLPVLPLSQIGSWVVVGIMTGGNTIGYLLLGRLAPNSYNTETATYLSPFAAQAAIALQNAKLYADASEALARERHFGEIVRAASSTLDLPTILHKVVNLAADLLAADSATVGLTSPCRDWSIITHADRTPEQLRIHQPWCNQELIHGVLDAHQTLFIRDTCSDGSTYSSNAAQEVHSVIAVPVVTGEISLGVLEFLSLSADKHFDEQDVALAESVGQEAGMAVQKARLLEAAHQRAEEAETLRQAGAAVTSTLQLNATLELILEQLQHVVPYDTASVQFLRPDHLEIVSGRGWNNPAAVLGVRFEYPGNNPNSSVIHERQPVMLSQAHIPDASSGREIRSWLGVPLIIHDQVIGMLTMDSYEPEHFRADHIRLASAFADQVAVALENARLFERVHQLAITDELTGLYNRRRFFELAEQAIEQTLLNGRDLCVLMIDIDDFKRVNDTYGHLTGDKVLREVAQHCQSVLGPDDLFARYGGEEFVALIPNVNTARAQTIGEHMCQTVAQNPIDYQSGSIVLTVSVGLSTMDRSVCTLETLVMRADEAQYIAKKAGGNRLMVWRS